VDVDGIGLYELDEEVDFGIVEQSEGLPVVFSWVIVGIHVVLVGLHEPSPLSLHEIHIYMQKEPPLDYKQISDSETNYNR
jgi:hypothetical protein